MAVNILFSPKENWDISRLDPPYGGLSPRSANSRELTASLVTAKVAIPAAINSLSSSIFLNAYVIEAVLLHANKLPNVKASLLSVSDQNASNVVWYVSELDQDDGSVILADYQINLDTDAASLNGSAVIPLANGGYVRRHPDALCIYTDNVGYVSCRPVDPSVIRRMALIIDSYEMPEKTVLARVKYNTGIKDKNLLKVMYDTWKKLLDMIEDAGKEREA